MPRLVAMVLGAVLAAPSPVFAAPTARCGDGKITISMPDGSGEQRQTLYCRDGKPFVLVEGSGADGRTRRADAVTMAKWDAIWRAADQAEWKTTRTFCARKQGASTHKLIISRDATVREMSCPGLSPSFQALVASILRPRPSRDATTSAAGKAAPTAAGKLTVTTVAGARDSDEAEGLGNADRITGPCKVFRLAYFWSKQGQSEDRPPFTARPGQVVDSGGGAVAAKDRARLSFKPRADEVVVLHNDSYLLDRKRSGCRP